MFLTADELKRLTGFVRRSAQIRWLTSRGFRFEVNGVGAPIVATAEVEARLLSTPRARAGAEPRWAAVNERPPGWVPRVRFDDPRTRSPKRPRR